MKFNRRHGEFKQGCVLSESYTATDALLPILPACRQPLLLACVFVTQNTVRHPRLFFSWKICSWWEAFMNRDSTVFLAAGDFFASQHSRCWHGRHCGVLVCVTVWSLASSQDRFISLARAECDDSLPFSGASSIPLCSIFFPATLRHWLFFHPPSLHLTIYFLGYLLVLLIPNSYTILFWELYFIPFSIHVQTNTIYVDLLFLLW
jgi:hypothetical protein